MLELPCVDGSKALLGEAIVSLLTSEMSSDKILSSSPVVEEEAMVGLALTGGFLMALPLTFFPNFLLTFGEPLMESSSEPFRSLKLLRRNKNPPVFSSFSSVLGLVGFGLVIGGIFGESPSVFFDFPKLRRGPCFRARAKPANGLLDCSFNLAII